MTAVLTASGLGGPVGRLLVGPVYNWTGNAGVWVLLAGGVSLGAVLFATVAVVRGRELDLHQATPTTA
jgi:hypothetical protein